MGLKMTLPKDKNVLYYDFIDAYWAIDDVIYTIDQVSFILNAYPSRESRLKNFSMMGDPSIDGYGESIRDRINSILYRWRVRTALTDIFTDGSIPAGKDEQYKKIYNWIKEYTQLPFEDVFES